MGESRPLRTPRSTRSSLPAAPRWSSGEPASISARLSPTWICRPRRRRAPASGGRAVRRGRADAAHARLAAIDPAAAAVHATTGAASCARSSSRRSERRSHRPASRSRRRDETPDPGGWARRAEGRARRRIDERTRRCSTPASAPRSSAHSPARSATARKTMGIDEVATLPRDEAIEVLIARTRRYAATSASGGGSRGIVIVDADRAGGRSPMTSSRWHAHGNVYLVSEGPVVRDQARNGRRRPDCRWRGTSSRSGSNTDGSPRRCRATG